jgi:hypothetical protein
VVIISAQIGGKENEKFSKELVEFQYAPTFDE